MFIFMRHYFISYVSVVKEIDGNDYQLKDSDNWEPGKTMSVILTHELYSLAKINR